jgi:hypothetical protein
MKRIMLPILGLVAACASPSDRWKVYSEEQRQANQRAEQLGHDRGVNNLLKAAGETTSYGPNAPLLDHWEATMKRARELNEQDYARDLARGQALEIISAQQIAIDDAKREAEQKAEETASQLRSQMDDLKSQMELNKYESW